MRSTHLSSLDLNGNPTGLRSQLLVRKIFEQAPEDLFHLPARLTVLKALESVPYGQLSQNVLTALRYIASRLEKRVARDPANEGNMGSNDLSSAEKTVIARAAREVIYDENWKKILW